MTIEEWAKDFKSYVCWLDMPRDDYNGIMKYIDDALALLKEQKPEKVLSMKRDLLLPGHYDLIGNCPGCHEFIEQLTNRHYCGYCGKAVIWE